MKRGHGAAAVLLSACSTAALHGQALMRPACAPNDAASVELIVPASSSSEYPQLRVVVWRSEVEGTRVTVPGPNRATGTAAWCTADLSCRELKTANVAFGRTRADGLTLVVVDARLPNGTRFRRTSRARWRGSRIPCG